jgi:taurine--2-oxoglutarate transaminase
LICSNLGHKNKAIIEAICEQAKKMPYLHPGFASDVRAKVSKLLLEIMPPGLEKFFYSASGTEANEAAIKIVRMFSAQTGKYKIISRYSSYHGSTSTSIAATVDPRRWPIEPTGKVQGVVFAPDCYCYRCPFNLEYPYCDIACAEYVDYMLRNEGKRVKLQIISKTTTSPTDTPTKLIL